jgi:hypothetical protein
MNGLEMTDREKQREGFREALDRKSEQAREASHNAPRHPGGDDVELDPAGQMQPGIQTDDRGSQDVFSPRAKNSGHGKTTADKWNQ